MLIHPSAILRADLEQQRFLVSLTKAQVEKSPELAEDQPVSQQMENRLYTYYGWDPLWGGPYLSETPGAIAWPYMAPPYFGLGLDTGEAHGKRASLHGSDPHVRSVNEITGYHIHAVDGEIGHVENFMIDDADWSIHYFIVDTRNWWFGKRVLISPLAVKSIEWFDRHRRARRVARTDQVEPAVGSSRRLHASLCEAASQTLRLAGICRLGEIVRRSARLTS